MSATRHAFRVTLEQDVIVSRSAATAGEHETLDHLPGSLFLGLAAGRLYASLAPDQAWQVFHGGGVRFCDALPESEPGTPAWPVPLALHHYKNEDAKQKVAGSGHARLDRDRVLNLMHREPEDGRQPRQLRGGHVDACGRWIRPRTRQSLKTAIAPETGRVEEGQLFGYEALERGQSFVFELQTDDTLDEALVQRLHQCLNGPARLGRSRSAEFGRVQIEPLDQAPPHPASVGGSDNTLTLWLLSDLALRDERGQPTLQPRPQYLGLPEGAEWDHQKSFLRTRSYSPYNGKRRGRDADRQVIARGSVLHYTLPAGTPPEALPALEHGLGHYREAGLGQAVARPQMLADKSLQVEAPAARTTDTRSVPAAPDTALLRRLRRMARTEFLEFDAEHRARRVFEALIASLDEARSWQGIPPNAPLAEDEVPGRSQWGRLRDAANRHRGDPDGLWRALFPPPKDSGATKDREPPEDAIVRTRSGWQLKLGPRQEDVLGVRLKAQLEAIHRNVPELLSEVVVRLASLGQTPEWTRAVEGHATKEPQA
ncbi:hypothetical protein [Thioalkalivibrio sp. ALR17-21]|uniref:hypothetical protein n=1 Tax=Thioalkalivibrio sp. ALR17-21 TaxID=1269813 RepID=UPI00041E7391|nr:hypothetical protein [Thioalkalivibrio sp. ALR17-21]